MRGNDQHFNVGINNPIEDVVRKAWHWVLANCGRELDAIATGRFAHIPHRFLESQQIASAESSLAGLVVRDMLKMLNARGFVKKVTHFNKAFACRRTSSAEMRLDKP